MSQITEGLIGLPDPEKEVLSPHLTWDEFVFLSDQGWGLRHVSSQDDAKKELREGVAFGDAVSLAAPLNLIPKEALDNVEGFRYMPPSTVLRSIPDQYKQQIVLNFEHAVKLFLEDCAGWDINKFADEATSTKDIANRLIFSDFAFLIAKFQGAENPYDVQAYYGLGKCGKKNVSPENMVSLIKLDTGGNRSDVDFGFSEEELASPLSEEGFNRFKKVCSVDIWGKIVETVREKRGVL